MEISKENVFKTQYTSIIGQALKGKMASKLKQFIKNNKIISITIVVFFMCLSLNCILIYSFIKVVETYKI